LRRRAGQFTRRGLVLAAGLMSSTVAGGQDRPVVWSASLTPATIVRGAVVVVHLTARIDEGWHLYSITQGPGGPIPTRIAVAPDQPFALAETIKGPAAIKQFDPNFGIGVETYDAQATFAVPVRVAPDAPLGASTLGLTARFQTCNATLCLPPHTERISVPIVIAPTTARTASSRS
jgi:DsbC/DsbD-like thiol-disulfide interchange protein